MPSPVVPATFRVVSLDMRTDAENVIQAGIASEVAARVLLRNEVRQFLNIADYADELWELRWMPDRDQAMFRELATRRVVFWRLEAE